MRHGIHIPPDQRDDMAVEAVKIANAAQSRTKGIATVASRFAVSVPTARNLISRGKYLIKQAG